MKDLDGIDAGVYVAGQIIVSDIPFLVNMGIHAIICNRPDGEAKEQPSFFVIQKAAVIYGIDAYYLPIFSSGVTESNIQDMMTLLSKGKYPLFLYCRSGKRSDILYKLVKKRMEEASHA
ncbi:MAG: hypothetical protein JSC161_000470 [Candidatus Tokpelaia sp. JSC161]|jgi:sulfide:quinone oxidoreductase|nr:MAG: hypothetical protein JSC161_000470 [Candidatus Tokpelaia sp. JSC161]